MISMEILFKLLLSEIIVVGILGVTWDFSDNFRAKVIRMFGSKSRAYNIIFIPQYVLLTITVITLIWSV